MIKTVMVGKGRGLTEYIYDDAGRVSLTKEPRGAKTTYSYSPGLVVMQGTDSAGKIFKTDTLYLNDNGKVATSVNHHRSGSFMATFLYDDSGFVKQIVNYEVGSSRGDTLVFTIANGNVLTSQNPGSADRAKDDAEHAGFKTIYYDYYMDKINTTGIENKGEPFFGRSSRNLIKSAVTVGSNGDTLSIVSFQYEYDPKGRAQSVIRIDRSGMKGDPILYTYYQ